MKRLFLLILIFFLFNNKLYSHVTHYEKIKLLKYNIYFNDDLVGNHIFNFKKKGNKLEVSEKGFFKVSKFGIDLMKYETKSKSIYEGNQLIKYDSNTMQNDKEKFVSIKFSDNNLDIVGSSFKGKIEPKVPLSSLWNHELVKQNKQISSVSGSINNYKVKFLGKKKIFNKNKSYETLNFHIFSDDQKKMKDKKINIKIWYNIEDLLWVKASYEKLGIWEYRLEDVKY